ncbi:MAG: hypothetical protein A2Z72_06995 [Omnitrophica bacterium RBG_13_46_9]|nr:MAG: hypothetical protein A2Z72_06995 [Omnitrophica bacterium RBG_13_46_9]
MPGIVGEEKKMKKENSDKSPNVAMEEHRRFIRHPISFPLEFEYAPKKLYGDGRTINVSLGGLLFSSKHSSARGKIIILKLPLKDKLFRVKAKVMHVRHDISNSHLYDIGVSFLSYSEAFKAKLVEQIYLIDEYRSLRSIQLNREVDFEEASREWVERFSKRFDRMFWGADTRNKNKE